MIWFLKNVGDPKNKKKVFANKTNMGGHPRLFQLHNDELCYYDGKRYAQVVPGSVGWSGNRTTFATDNDDGNQTWHGIWDTIDKYVDVADELIADKQFIDLRRTLSQNAHKLMTFTESASKDESSMVEIGLHIFPDVKENGCLRKDVWDALRKSVKLLCDGCSFSTSISISIMENHEIIDSCIKDDNKVYILAKCGNTMLVRNLISKSACQSLFPKIYEKHFGKVKPVVMRFVENAFGIIKYPCNANRKAILIHPSAHFEDSIDFDFGFTYLQDVVRDGELFVISFRHREDVALYEYVTKSHETALAFLRCVTCASTKKALGTPISYQWYGCFLKRNYDGYHTLEYDPYAGKSSYGISTSHPESIMLMAFSDSKLVPYMIPISSACDVHIETDTVLYVGDTCIADFDSPTDANAFATYCKNLNK